jgi:hypothetical protein
LHNISIKQENLCNFIAPIGKLWAMLFYDSANLTRTDLNQTDDYKINLNNTSENLTGGYLHNSDSTLGHTSQCNKKIRTPQRTKK